MIRFFRSVSCYICNILLWYQYENDGKNSMTFLGSYIENLSSHLLSYSQHTPIGDAIFQLAPEWKSPLQFFCWNLKENICLDEYSKSTYSWSKFPIMFLINCVKKFFFLHIYVRPHNFHVTSHKNRIRYNFECRLSEY